MQLGAQVFFQSNAITKVLPSFAEKVLDVAFAPIVLCTVTNAKHHLVPVSLR